MVVIINKLLKYGIRMDKKWLLINTVFIIKRSYILRIFSAYTTSVFGDLLELCRNCENRTTLRIVGSKKPTPLSKSNKQKVKLQKRDMLFR
jgi:hypothetical protein